MKNIVTTAGGELSPPAKLLFEKISWTIEDVAKELHCSVRHIKKLVSLGRIPYGKVGRLVRFSPVKVCEWLQKGGTR